MRTTPAATVSRVRSPRSPWRRHAVPPSVSTMRVVLRRHHHPPVKGTTIPVPVTPWEVIPTSTEPGWLCIQKRWIAGQSCHGMWDAPSGPETANVHAAARIAHISHPCPRGSCRGPPVTAPRPSTPVARGSCPSINSTGGFDFSVHHHNHVFSYMRRQFLTVSAPLNGEIVIIGVAEMGQRTERQIMNFYPLDLKDISPVIFAVWFHPQSFIILLYAGGHFGIALEVLALIH